ncbi:VWFA and cache domain-containing protein 1 [Anabarilius grahami]|uniref:VWFA and cache domain-containing protein 1 n=1 Tax=Anabarilius grahami TaxID=495550 RepID=A0A3N0YXF1_ANAGA|nr:VWFA and cache domain-containing protein 1 [Anabarilius grahami]
MASRTRTGSRFSLAAWSTHSRSYRNNLRISKWSLVALLVFVCGGFCGADSEFSILEEAQVLAVQMKKLSTQELGVLTMQRDEKGPYCIRTRLFFISASFPFKLTAPSLQGPDHLDNPLVVRLLSKQSNFYRIEELVVN